MAFDVAELAIQARQAAREAERRAEHAVKRQKDVLAEIDRRLAAVRATPGSAPAAPSGGAEKETTNAAEALRAREAELIARGRTELQHLEQLEGAAKEAREMRTFREHECAKAQAALSAAEERAASSDQEVRSRGEAASKAGVARQLDLNRFLDEYRRRAVGAQRCRDFQPSELNTARTSDRIPAPRLLLGRAMQDPERVLFASGRANGPSPAPAVHGSSVDVPGACGAGVLPHEIRASVRARLREFEDVFRNQVGHGAGLEGGSR